MHVISEPSPVRPRPRGRRLVAVVAALAAGVVSLLTGAVLAAPVAQAAEPELSHVGAASTKGTRSVHRVAIPASVRAGDVLLLAMTWNSTRTAPNPTGWTRLRARSLDGMTARVWTRVATGADAGRNVRVDTSGRTKSIISVAAYRSTGSGAAVTASATADASRTRNHTAPEVAVTDPGSWVVSAWGEKSGVAQTWTLPAGASRRTGAATTGSGKVSQVLADSAGPVAPGTAPARTARTSKRAALSASFSVVVSPGTADETNRAPIASFTSGCTDLTCEFDASASSDPDADALTYTWDLGDGTTATGATAQHTYADAGRRTVTLRVSDGTDDNTTTRQVEVTTPGPDPAPNPGRQPVPGHSEIVPEGASRTMPLIEEGEVWDIEVIGNRAFVAGSFSSLTDRSTGTAVNQAFLAAFNLNTGRVDTTFRPVFGNGDVRAVEASPDGTRLYVAGSFTSVNGVTKRRIASINPATGAPVTGFQANSNNRATALAVTGTTVYVGGRFATINGQDRVGLAAVDATTGAVDAGFDNQLSGGIGVNGVLTVQQLQLTHDSSRLLVVHTARRIDGQDRYGVGLVDTASKQLLPWRTRLWEDNLQHVGGIQRIYAGDIAPDDSYFVVTSGSGGDRPPINDTAIAFSFDGADNREPLWISRAFDSIYSVAVTERAVYIGGHFQWNESPTAPDPWPGLDDRGYGTGQGLSAYALGDAVVRRDHLGALDPADGKALEWHPGSNSYEGNKAMLATPHGLITGGDGMRQGGFRSGRIAFFDFDELPAPSNPDTTITTPIAGRVVPTGQPVVIEGTATSSDTIQRVQVEIQRGNQYLQDDLTTWTSTFNTIFPDLGTRAGQVTPWSLPVTFAQSGEMTIRARARTTSNVQDPVKATKKIEAFSFEDLPPTTRITGPGSFFGTSLLPSTSFVLRGSATDDKGVASISLYLRDVATDRYLTANGTLVDEYTTFRIDPDVPGSVSTTWQYEVNLPNEGNWKVGAMARDTAGQGDTRWETREYTVDSSGQPPTVRITEPVAVTPPTTSPTLSMAPGGKVTFRGTATDDQALATVEVSLRNETTRENLASDGSWGADVINGWYKVSPAGLDQASYGWSFTTPADLVPGTYTFRVRASDKQDLSTSGSMQGRITIDVAVPGDLPPDGLLDLTGTQTSDQLRLALTGTATDDLGVTGVRVAIMENATDRYLQPGGTLAAGFSTIDARLASPGATSTTWSLPVDLPSNGDYSVTAYAVDTAGQLDRSTSGATARYLVFPGDAPPELLPNLASPTDGTAFTEARIFVSGRAEDDRAIGAVQVAVVDTAGLWMSSNGSFGTTERWVSAFLNSPGSPGSNYSYTTPVIPDGSYRVLVRPVDTNGQYPEPREVTVTVAAPAGNQAPTAAGTVTCDDNVCAFDGRGSTDDNAATLTYSWDFGNGRTASGALATHTYTTAGSFSPTLTVRDEYGLTATVALDPLDIGEPDGNRAPTAVISPPTCVGLVCNFAGSTSSDPDEGDSLTYAWDFGDGTTSTSANPSQSYAAGGTYSVSLTVTDGWGRSSTATSTVSVTP